MKYLGYAALTIVALVLLTPTLLLIEGAFRTGDDMVVHLIPHSMTLSNFVTLFAYPVFRWFANSALVSIASTALMTSAVVMAGYAFAKKTVPAKEAIFWAMLASMMIPATVVFVPTFVILKNVGLINSLWGLILPAILSVQMIFFFRQYISAMPNDFLDSAAIDGCGEIGTFLRVVVPMSLPAIATIGLLNVTASWGAFLWPNAILFTPERYTLPVGIQRILFNEAIFRSRNALEPDFGLIMAASTFTLAPVVALFTIFHKAFVKGLWGGLK